MKLLLVRHGLTDWNIAQRFQGQRDIPLNAAGRRQATLLRERLAREPIAAIYASDLQRAWNTAQAIAADHDCPLTPEPHLREISFGQWEGLTYTEIRQRAPAELEFWEANVSAVAPPGGETVDQLAQRVESVLKELQAKHSADAVLLVAHGGPLQVLLCMALGLPGAKYWQFHLAPASLSRVSFYPAGAILDVLNDTCHLEEE